MDYLDKFKLTDHKYCLFHYDGDFDWIIRSIENYKELVVQKPYTLIPNYIAPFNVR